jgi:hypothetical protein
MHNAVFRGCPTITSHIYLAVSLQGGYTGHKKTPSELGYFTSIHYPRRGVKGFPDLFLGLLVYCSECLIDFVHA